MKISELPHIDPLWGYLELKDGSLVALPKQAMKELQAEKDKLKKEVANYHQLQWQHDALIDENEKMKAELEKVQNIVDCKIRLVLLPKYLMDILSIREWNDFITSYEKDRNVTIHDNMDKYIAFDTTLGNIVCNHSLLDLRFVSLAYVPKDEK